MKQKIKDENRWDPIVLKLLKKRGAPEFFELQNDIHEPVVSTKVREIATLPKRRSEEEFKKYLRSLFANDPLKVKYQNPDLWIPRKKKKRI